MAFPWRCLVYDDGSFYRTSNIGGSLDDYSDADLAHMTPSATRTKPRRGSRSRGRAPAAEGTSCWTGMAGGGPGCGPNSARPATPAVPPPARPAPDRLSYAPRCLPNRAWRRGISIIWPK